MAGWSVIDPQVLRALDLFERFTDDELVEVATYVTRERFRRNELIIAEGTAGDRLFFILGGEVRVSRSIPGVGEEALAILPAGSYFGEMALFGEQKRSADVYADRTSELLVLRIDEFKALLETRPELASKFLWAASRTLADRLRAANAKVTFLSAAGQFG